MRNANEPSFAGEVRKHTAPASPLVKFVVFDAQKGRPISCQIALQFESPFLFFRQSAPHLRFGVE